MSKWLETTTASEDFKRNILGGIRYVDKTRLLVPLLRGEHETTFFLRPRRFGKTLTLSMIRCFVEDTKDPALNAENRALFRGMEVMRAGERFTGQMTRYPVIHLTLQTLGGQSFEEAYERLTVIIRKVYQEKRALMDSPVLDDLDRRYYQRILYGQDEAGEKATRTDFVYSLRNLSEFLRRDAGQRTVVLIDEYDVPLEKAYRNHYYREMVEVIGPLLQSLLKTNSENLQFAVVTGCLRIAKEGIYTGLNNPEINTVLSDRNSDAIGFTEADVRTLLEENGFADHFAEVKVWYDGYRFGNSVIYNPWSVIKHIEDLGANPHRTPRLHWAGTSENAIIREMARRADAATREKIDQAMLGQTITFAPRDNIVYDDMYTDPDNVFNVMLATGYLTAEHSDTYEIRARIPNKEVHRIFEEQIRSWFEETLPAFDVKALYAAMEQEQPEQMQEILNDQFLASMSYHDTVEAFYHGVTMTLLQLDAAYIVTSSRESGSGRFDIQCKKRKNWDLAFVIECKVSDAPKNMLTDVKKAVKQVQEKKYVNDLLHEGYARVMTYGIAFCEKRCRIAQGAVYKGEE